MRRAGKLLLISGLTYCLAGLGVYLGMRQPPDAFSRAAAAFPAGLIFATMPAETLWKLARAGKLQPGDPAPDFTLPTADKTSEVQLSSHRGVRPVMLIFGSYT